VRSFDTSTVTDDGEEHLFAVNGETNEVILLDGFRIIKVSADVLEENEIDEDDYFYENDIWELVAEGKVTTVTVH
jgi:hypothetical protein